MKRIALILLSVFLFAGLTSFGASENSVDRSLSVKDDYEFKPGNAFVNLRIEEKNAYEFTDDPFEISITLENAEWFEDTDAINCSDMEGDTNVNVAGSTISIRRISSKKIYVTLDRNNTNTDVEAYWKIPVYAKVVNDGELKLSVDGRNTYVSNSTHVIGNAVGDSNRSDVNIGYQYDLSNNYWVTIKEPKANAFGTEDQIFRLELNSSEWFKDTNEKLNLQAMLENSKLSGVEYNEIKAIERISDKIIEVTLNRGKESSVYGTAVWSIPLYHVVTEYGEVSIKIEGLKSQITEGEFSKAPVVNDIIKNLKVMTLQMNNNQVAIDDNGLKTNRSLDVAPINEMGTTMVPLRGILEELGAGVTWRAETRQIEIKNENTSIVLTVGSNMGWVDGKEVTLVQAPKIVNSRTLIPLRFISENLGYKVDWNEENQEITIY